VLFQRGTSPVLPTWHSNTAFYSMRDVGDGHWLADCIG